MNLKKLGLAVISAQLVAFAAWAHHSHGAYAMTDYTEIDGVVTEVYGVAELTARSLISTAGVFHPIDESLLVPPR